MARDRVSGVAGWFEYTGLGLMVIATLLTLLNLYDGIRKLRGTRFRAAVIVLLVAVYLLASTRVVLLVAELRLR